MTVYRGRPLLLAWFFLYTVHCTLYTPAFADTLYYSSGETLKGLVVEEHRDRVVVNTEGGEKTVFREELDEIFYSDPERNYLYLGSQALEDGEFSLARGFFRKALQMNPRLSEAGDALSRLEELEQRQAQRMPAGAAAVGAVQGTLGLILAASYPSAAVEAVRAASPAGAAGVAAGDRLVAIWGCSLAFLPVEEVAGRLPGPAGTTFKLTVEREVRLPPGAGSPRDWPREMAATPISRGWPGVTLEMQRLGLTVQGATPGRAAAQAGLLPGDRIVRIAGKSTRYRPLQEAERRIAEAWERGISLHIHRDLMIERE